LRLISLGVCDSKLVPSLAKIRSLAAAIKQTKGIEYEVVSVGPERYNELYEHFKNLNSFLAWGHTRVIAGLLEKVPDCPRALSDQFAHEVVLKRALASRKLSIKLEQRTKAESDVAVAAASILARERFVNWMDAASKAGKVELPLGASSRVISAAKKIIEVHGEEMLPKVAKMHFKTTQSVLKGKN
jgi:ribonuclease HIII